MLARRLASPSATRHCRQIHRYHLEPSHASRVTQVRMASTNRATADDAPDPQEVAGASMPSTQPAKNAFTELMKPRPKPQVDAPSKQTFSLGRDGLAAYTEDPERYPTNRVVYYNDNFVVINDLFPKSVVHMLILPRDKRKSVMHPTDAFDDPEFLALARKAEKKVRAIAASELQRQLGKYSVTERARLEAMDSDEPPDTLPPGRDWDKEIMTGIHANPSMNHLHIHVLSRDLYSEKMKKYNHYLSFTSDFFTRMDEFPLAVDDHRRDYKHFQNDMLCWRCGKNFGRKMAELKRHLEIEFDEWKRE